MVLVAPYGLMLHHMDIKVSFPNDNLYKDMFIKWPKGFRPDGQEHSAYKFNKSIYGLK